MTSPRKVAGARVLITGGASGLGALLATELAMRGATEIVLWDRDAEGLERVAGQLELLGAHAHSYRVELTDAADIAETGERTLAALGGIDICINSAGVVAGRDFSELTDEALVRTFEVNTLAQFRVIRAVLPGMLERDRGVLVNIASAAGLTGVARQTDYSASKFASVGFTESLRAELRKRGSGLRTLLVCPYYVNTGMFAGVRSRVPLLLPTLDQHRVARQITDAIESGKQRLILPPFATTALLVRALPVPIADAILDLFGINHTMDGFVGRQLK